MERQGHEEYKGMLLKTNENRKTKTQRSRIVRSIGDEWI